MGQFIKGITHFFTSFGFIFKNRLGHYYLYPILISVLFYISMMSLVYVYAYDIVYALIKNYLPDHLPKMDGWLSVFNTLGNISIYGIISVVFIILVLLLSASLSKYIVLIILSPVFSLMSEAIDSKITGQKFDFELVQFLKDIIRGVLVSLRNLMIELFWMALFGVISIFSSGFGVITYPILIVIGAYFYGYSMMDYTCERRKMSISEGTALIKQNKWFAIGLGLMYWVLDKVPFVGLVIAPINALCGATTGMIEIERERNGQSGL